MHIRRRAAELGLFSIVAVASPAHAQGTTADSGSASNLAQPALEVWTGQAVHSSRMGFLGDTPNVNLALVAVRWTRPVRMTARSVLEYTVDVVPMALLSPPLPTRPGSQSPSAICDGLVCEILPLPSRFPSGSSFGIGVSPFGLTWVLRPADRVRPFLAGTGGLLWSDRQVPTTNGARVNFVATAEAGVRVGVSERTDVTAAYRFHHLSNAGLARENAALASHVFSLGVRVRYADGRAASAAGQ